eukprot:TRINITY_DN20830_c0_g1_i1.p1 TRINITY_DN20830_c0_g1~~TRINITY_DN20830_c0_g1_i1.p1  ORF type:complete len:679 (-),score=66.88 TRINITY_DN20830_c0_g1_i1:96-2039(-)
MLFLALAYYWMRRQAPRGGLVPINQRSVEYAVNDADDSKREAGVPVSVPHASSAADECEASCVFEDFEQACRCTVLGSGHDANAELHKTFSDAMSFARAIYMGVSSFCPSAELVTDSHASAETVPVLRLKPRTPLKGEFATKSRIPFDLYIEEEGLELSLSALPPAKNCPFRSACHRRCFGPASGGDKPWAKLDLIFGEDGDSQTVSRTFLAAPQAFQADHHGLPGLQVVVVPENDFSKVDVRGAAAVVTEKAKPGTKSDGAVVRDAQAAGASCVIKVGGGGSMLYCVADPVAIPCIAISKEDGEALMHLLQGPTGKRGNISEYTEIDTRADLISKRWQNGMLWLHCKGLRFRTIDWESPLCRAVSAEGNAHLPMIYEDYYGFFHSHKDSSSRISPDSSKFRRIVESAWSQLHRVGLSTNPPMLGKMLALGGQRCEFTADYFKFAPGQTQANTAVSMLLTPISAQGGRGEDSTASDLQAWVAHEAVYLALMGQFTRLIGFMAPSLWNFIKCVNGEFFGWEADAEKMTKLFTPCTGPVGPPPALPWQQNDPTWRIVDEKVLGITTRTQGRVLWSESLAASASEDAKGEAAYAGSTFSTLGASEDGGAAEVVLQQQREPARGCRQRNTFMRLAGICMTGICNQGRGDHS